jgi:DNA polymerase
MTPDQIKAAREILAFYLEAGVDVALGEEPVDRFAEPPAPVPGSSAAEPPHDRTISRAAAPPVVATAAAATAAPLAPDAAVMAARSAAKEAQSLEELRAILAGFSGCALKSTARQLVFADGAAGSRVMLVGEAPGREEDLEGLPFVGRSGQLLDRMMAAIGLTRRNAYIANVIPWRPPGNRTPTPQETAICLPFILRQIELCDPDILVCLGGPSASALLGVRDGITRIRGRWFAYRTGRDIRAIATLHPAYLLRQPLQKRLAWRDFLAVQKALEETGVG